MKELLLALVVFVIGIIGYFYIINKVEKTKWKKRYREGRRVSRRLFEHNENGKKLVEKIIRNNNRITVLTSGEFFLDFDSVYTCKIKSSFITQYVINGRYTLSAFKIELFHDDVSILKCQVPESHKLYRELDKVLNKTYEQNIENQKKIVKELLEEL